MIRLDKDGNNALDLIAVFSLATDNSFTYSFQHSATIQARNMLVDKSKLLQ